MQCLFGMPRFFRKINSSVGSRYGKSGIPVKRGNLGILQFSFYIEVRAAGEVAVVTAIMFRLRTDRVVPIDKEELEVVRYSSSHDIEMEEVPLANHLPIKKRVDSGEHYLPELEAEAEDVEIEKSKSAEQRAKGSANNNTLVSKQYSEDKSSLSSPTGNDKSNLPDAKELLMRRNSRLGNDNELSASIITASTTSSSISSSSSSLSRRKSFRKSDNPIDLMPTASLSTSSSALPPQRSSVERRGSRQFLNLPTLAPPPILLLPFDAFVKAGAMPRFPVN